MNLSFGGLRREDYRRAAEFACVGMHFDRYVDDERACRLYGRFFLYEELLGASQVIAAYDGDRLEGLLLADMRGEPKACSSWAMRCFVATGRRVVGAAETPYRLSCAKMLVELERGTAVDGEIGFLAANPDALGKGIGSALVSELARREEGKLVYLFTDSNCSYQFYDHRGFARRQEQRVEQGEGRAPFDCYLYTKRL